MNCAAWIMKIISVWYVSCSNKQLYIVTSLSFTVIVKYWRASKRNWVKRIDE